MSNKGWLLWEHPLLLCSHCTISLYWCMAWTVRVHTENSAHLYLAVCNHRSSTSSILQISGKQNDASPNICMLHIIQTLFACSFSYSHEECYCQL